MIFIAHTISTYSLSFKMGWLAPYITPSDPNLYQHSKAFIKAQLGSRGNAGMSASGIVPEGTCDYPFEPWQGFDSPLVERVAQFPRHADSVKTPNKSNNLALVADIGPLGTSMGRTICKKNSTPSGATSPSAN
jgi:hypothetical protein